MSAHYDPQTLLRLTTDQRSLLVAQLKELVTPDRLARMDAVLATRTSHLTVVLEDIGQPHNASAVLRTSECLGVQDVHIVEGVRKFRPNVKIVHGAARWLTLHRWRETEGQDTASCLASLRSAGYRIVATSPREDAIPLQAVPLEEPLAVCFGTEETGLTSEALESADMCVRVPMPGFTRSLNVSVTAALVLYELTTRLRTLEIPWALSDARCDELRLLWLAQDSRGACGVARAALAAADLLPARVPYFLDRPGQLFTGS